MDAKTSPTKPLLDFGYLQNVQKTIFAFLQRRQLSAVEVGGSSLIARKERLDRRLPAQLLLVAALLLGAQAAAASDAVRDPFATLSNAPKPPETAPMIRTPERLYSSFELKAILWGEQPLANISGMIVAPGDRVHDYVVETLSRQSVLLRRADDTIFLVLEKDS